MAEERTYIPFTSRAKATTFDGILTEAHQIEDLDYGGQPKNQHDINAEVKGKLEGIDKQISTAIVGVYRYKGTKDTFDEVSKLTNVKRGDTWNVAREFTLKGEKYPAGTNVAALADSSVASNTNWDALGGSVDLQPITERIEKVNTNTSPRFDGIVNGEVVVKNNSAVSYTKIVYLEQKKTFAAVAGTGLLGADEYYATWAGERPVDLYKNGLSAIKNKTYIYGSDVYAFDAEGNLHKTTEGLATEAHVSSSVNSLETKLKSAIDGKLDKAVLVDDEQNKDANKVLSARAARDMAVAEALARQGRVVTDIARAVKGVKIETVGYSGGQKHTPKQLVWVYEPSAEGGGWTINSLCVFIDGKYYNAGGMNEESLAVKEQGNFLRTPDGSVYTQGGLGNTCIYDSSNSSGVADLEARVAVIEGLLSLDGNGSGGSGGGGGGSATGNVIIVQGTGQSKSAVMSQKAVTDEVSRLDIRAVAPIDGILPTATIEPEGTDTVEGIYYIVDKKVFAAKSAGKYYNSWFDDARPKEMYLKVDQGVKAVGEKVYIHNATLYAIDEAGNLVEAGGAGMKVVQTTGQSTEDVMSQKAVTDEVGKIESKVDELMMGATGHIAAAWNYASDSPNAVVEAGDKNLVDFKIYLMDCTDNKGEASTPIGATQRNNLFRFEDGSFAPAVGITEEQRAECDVELYRKPNSGELVKYCNAGEYDAKKFYETYGIKEKLYNKDGKEVRVLLPWETTETKYSHFLGCQRNLYYISAAQGKSGKLWSAIFTSPQEWDGITALEHKPTAISPSPIACIKDVDGKLKTRCFFTLYPGLNEGNVHSAGSKGIGGLCTAFEGKHTYPTTNGIQQNLNAEWGRNNNADPAKTLPFAEGGNTYRDLVLSYLEIKYGRKDLHNSNFFGAGISSNYPCNSENTWRSNGGVRYKVGDSPTWKYVAMGGIPTDFFYNASKGTAYINSLLNNQFAKEAVMESQIAASWAVENKIQEGEMFDMYGETYWWQRVPGALGLLDGRMNTRIYKLVKTKINAFNADGGSVEVTLEVILAMSLFEGMKFSGDIFEYWGGGYEMVGTTNENSKVGSTGDLVRTFIQPDQAKWSLSIEYVKNPNEKFDFEDSYIRLEDSKTIEAFVKRRLQFGSYNKEKGGSMLSGECMCLWGSNAWSGNKDGKHTRIGSRFCGSAHYGVCAPRSLSANSSVLRGIVDFGGSAQVRLPQALAEATQ